MGVTDLPDDGRGVHRRGTEAFERAEFRYDPANHAVADATMTMYLTEVYGVPGAAACRRARRPRWRCSSPQLVAALGYDQPPAWLRAGVHAALRGRAHLLRGFAPPRRRPYRLTEVSRPTYPFGYRIDELGTFPDVDRAAKAGMRDGVAPRDVPSCIGVPGAASR